jgi:hypothetical protein
VVPPPYNFTSDDYGEHLTDDDWTERETRLLMNMCRQFELRFPVIHDRYSVAIAESGIHVSESND